jgi:hypothetical protein
VLLNEGNGSSFECVFSTYSDYNFVGNLYFCKVKNFPIVTESNFKLTHPTGSHSSGKSNSDVQGFYLHSSQFTVNYFPQGLDEYFSNLKSIRFSHVKIKEVHQSDLRPFAELIVLSFYVNQIEYIEKDLFKFNKKLKLVQFETNQLTYIDSNVFDQLNLKYLYLGENKCMNMNAESQEGTLKVIKEAKEKCSNSTQVFSVKQTAVIRGIINDANFGCEPLSSSEQNMIQTKIQDKFENIQNLINSQSNEITQLKNDLSRVKFESEEFESTLIQLKIEFNRKIEALNEIILSIQKSDLTAEIFYNETKSDGTLITAYVSIFIALPLMCLLSVLQSE